MIIRIIGVRITRFKLYQNQAIINVLSVIIVPVDLKCTIKVVVKGALRCDYTPPVTVKDTSIKGWSLDGSEISTGVHYQVTTDSSTSVLLIKNLTVDSAGKYSCIVGNDKLRKACVYQLGKGTLHYFMVLFCYERDQPK